MTANLTPVTHRKLPRNPILVHGKDTKLSHLRWAFWTRTGIYIIIDAILSLTMAFFIWKEKWHPIAALVTSILASALWLAACFLNAFIAYSNEYWFLNMDAWRKIVYGEAGLQAVLVLCYWAMMGFAAKAVHEWRKVKNGRGNRASVRKADEVSLDDRGNIGATQSETSRTMAGSAV